MNKAELRKTLKNARTHFTGVAEASLKTAQNILACDAYRKAKHIMGYLAFGNELSVDYVLSQALSEGKQVFVPHMISENEFVPARLAEFGSFKFDSYGIRCVPPPVIIIDSKIIDLVLVPALACDKNGNRMGMGAGCYDRFLPQVNATKIGVVWEALLLEELPRDIWDVPLDFVACENGIIKISQQTGGNNFEME